MKEIERGEGRRRGRRRWKEERGGGEGKRRG